MYLHEVCNENFALIQADWTVAVARQVIERLSPSHVIVHRRDQAAAAVGAQHPVVLAEYYYLYSKAEFLSYLGPQESEKTSVRDAIGLHEYGATPTYGAYSDAGKAPARSVIIERGHVAGFYDKTIPPGSPGTLNLKNTGVLRTGGGPPVSRSLIADFPEQVPLQQTQSLLVSLSVQAGKGGSLPIVLPSGATVDVVVQPNLGFVLEGIGEGSLVIDDPARSTLQFKLRGTQLGAGMVTVFAFHKQQLQGLITLAPTVVPATDSVGPRRSHKEIVEESIRISEPDLSLLIFNENVSGNPGLSFRLTALDANLGFHLKPFGPVDLLVEPLKYFQDFFEDIENLPLGTPQEKAFAQQRLAAKGCILFEKAIPRDLQLVLWSLRNQIKSVQIDSQEPWIPWEICKLEGEENGKVVEGPFFSEAFAITRWRMGIGMKPKLKLNNMALVVPRNSNLPNAASESAYIQSLANGGRKVTSVPATYLDVIAEMKKGEYDGWHFTGHGGFSASDPNRSAVVLEDQQLTPEDLCGVVKNVGNPKPLVFLNACQIGRNALSLTGIGGWASQFVDAGAGAFVGAYWSVYDQPAHDFAVALYRGLLGGMTIGKAVQEARLAIKPLGDPTWLAYTVFADPIATVV
jgi:hypothetical protein